MERRERGGTNHRPLRHNGMPYSGINILMLWASSVEQGFGSPSWMTFKQALELKAHVRKGEKGSLVVYANSVTKTEQNDAGEDVAREVHFLKGTRCSTAIKSKACPSSIT